MEDKLKKLREEITGLLAQIDEEGLLFIKKQATTMIYNATVQEMNRKNQESLLENHEENMKGKEEGQEIRKTEFRQSKFRPEDIYVDMAGEAKGYGNVVCGNIRVFFTLDELGKMVYITEKAAGKGEAGLLLYRWLKKERGDFLVENGIKSYPSPTIDALARYLAED